MQSQSLADLKLVRPMRVSNHMIVQCYASRTANIWNVPFHLGQLQLKCKYFPILPVLNMKSKVPL